MSYKETKTRTQSNVYSVREVTRDITQLTDGTVTTRETETIKEQAFIQQEQIQQEFAVAKEVYLKRRLQEWRGLIDGWQRRNVDARLEELGYIAENGEVAGLTGQSFRAALQEEQLSLQYSCGTWHSRSPLFSDSKKQERWERLLARCTPGDGQRSSFYFTTMVEQLQRRRSQRLQMDRVMARLAADEQRLSQTKSYSEPQRGVKRRIAPPLLPFSDADIKIADVLDQSENAVSSEVLEEYVFQCARSNGSDPQLLAPVLAHLLSSAILTGAAVTDWPLLQRVHGVQERSLHSFPQTPLLYWGKSSTEREWFANCSFQVDTVRYDNVWVELPVLARSPVYCETVTRFFYDTKQQEEQQTVSQLQAVELLQLVPPRDPEFQRLRRLQHELDSLQDTKEEIAELVQRKRELATTLQRLQLKARRT